MADAASLFSEHQAGLIRYFRRVISPAETARDLTQEVFLRIARAGVPDCPPDEHRAWIFRIARNLALNHVRDQAIRPAAVMVTVDPCQQARQDTAVAVQQALARLDTVDRDIFLLREVVGLSYDELASTCGLTVPAVRSRLHRTRLELRAMLSVPIRMRRGSRLTLRSSPERPSS